MLHIRSPELTHHSSDFFSHSFLAALSLRCCAGASSSCGKQGLLLVAMRRLLIAVASLVLGTASRCVGLVVVAHGLWGADPVVVVYGLSCSVAWGIFPDQGSNPGPLHWQVDS